MRTLIFDGIITGTDEHPDVLTNRDVKTIGKRLKQVTRLEDLYLNVLVHMGRGGILAPKEVAFELHTEDAPREMALAEVIGTLDGFQLKSGIAFDSKMHLLDTGDKSHS